MCSYLILPTFKFHSFLYKDFCFLAGDYKEGYYIGVEVGKDDPESEKPFYGPNQWPASGKYMKLVVSGYFFEQIISYSSLWSYIAHSFFFSFLLFPDILPGWRETMEKYHQQAL